MGAQPLTLEKGKCDIFLHVDREKWWFINTKHLWEEHSITWTGRTSVCDVKADWLQPCKLHVSVTHSHISEGAHRLLETKHKPLMLQPWLWLMRLMCGSYLPPQENERFIYYRNARWWVCVRQRTVVLPRVQYSTVCVSTIERQKCRQTTRRLLTDG